MQDCPLVLTLTDAVGLMVEFIVLQSPYSDSLSSVWAIFFTVFYALLCPQDLMFDITYILFFYYTQIYEFPESPLVMTGHVHLGEAPSILTESQA